MPSLEPIPAPQPLLVDPGRAAELRAGSGDWPSWDLTSRQLCDLELLANGTFTPLDGYLQHADHEKVLEMGRLLDGTVWPVPLSLAVDARTAASLADGDRLALRDPEGTMLAVLTVRSLWLPDDGDGDTVLLGGPVEAVQLPNQYDFLPLRRTPEQNRATVAEGGWARVLAVTTSQPLLGADLGELRGHVTSMGARVLVQAVVGDVPGATLDRFALTRVLQVGLQDLLPDTAWVLSLVPLAVREDPAQQAVLEALVARANGATHVWGPTDPTAAQALAEHSDELGLTVVPRSPSSGSAATVTVEQVHDRLARGLEIPSGVAPPAVLAELRSSLPPRHERGLTVFFTGFSGSGKSTIANVVATRLRELGGRKVTLLDGDLVRRHLSSELGFSREHRNLNVLRIGYVASEITKHGGIAVCAPIAPYDAIRKQNRAAIEATGGGYVLIHVATPLEVCEARDRKGLYARARNGEIPEFTGISDPYEDPDDADLRIDTTDITPEDAADQVIDHLRTHGWLP